MGTTTESYRRKKREKANQKNRRKRNEKLKGWYAPNTETSGSSGTGQV